MSVKMAQDDPKMTRNRRGLPDPRLIIFALLVIAIERSAPMAILAGAPIALITIVSLLDGWAATPQWAHAMALIASVALSASVAHQMRRPLPFPAKSEALSRLEIDGRVRHDALHALEDAPFTGGGPLWDAHIAEMRQRARSARLAPPRMTANDVDPYGVRFAALAILAIATIAAGGDAGPRLLAGFIPHDPRTRVAGIAELWIEPPAHTGKAPIYLLRARDALPGTRGAIEAPEGSIVRAQVNVRTRFRLSLKANGETIIGEREGPDKSNRVSMTLMKSGLLALSAGGRSGRWPVDIIDDRSPAVEFIEAPTTDSDGRLALTVKIDDDYGAIAAALRLRLDPEQERPLDAPVFDAVAKSESRLIRIDNIASASAQAIVGARAFSLDLNSDPWAGLKVIAIFVVTDAAGQTGETAPVSVMLPAKEFYNPLARAVIEQRQSLAIAPTEWHRAEWAFSGLTLGPELFFEKPTNYLLLRTAMWRINKEAGGDYKDAVEDFWPLALQLEDEALELARRRLESAKDALRDALEKGASPSEIEKLTEEMRAALQQYLQALAQSGQQTADDSPAEDEIVNSADLDAMLDNIRDLAKSGAENAARQALADLDDLLSNLRLSSRGGNGDEYQGGKAQGSGATGQAGDLIGRQRALADRSFERGQVRGAAGDDLSEEQSAIASDLSNLLGSLEGAGGDADPNSAAARSLDKALSNMRRSEEALQAEEFDSANVSMEQAIANLREGAESLAREQSAKAKAKARTGRGGSEGLMRDPLGRPIGNAYGQGVDVPEKSDAQRTRELLERLRRRISDGDRTDDEIKYLERLLERY